MVMGILYGNSSCLLVKGGITRLSELSIDVAKDWQGFGISNLKELAAGMGKGDVPVHDGSILAKASPGSIGHEFSDGGPGHTPSWQPPPAP